MSNESQANQPQDALQEVPASAQVEPPEQPASQFEQPEHQAEQSPPQPVQAASRPVASAPEAPASQAPAVLAPQAHTPGAQPVSAPRPQAPQAPEKRRGLSTFLKVSIILLAGLSVAAISLLFIGDFQGKFERIFSTFFAFAVFVGLTAFDTSRERRNDWYAPVALIANSYILALVLIVIWMTPAGWSLGWDIFWKSVLVIGVARAVVGAALLLLNMGAGHPRPLGIFALITSLLATLSGILFTAPVAIEVFNVRVPDLYWRFAVASLLLTALALAITVLLRWAYTGEDREASRRARDAERALQAQQQAAPMFPVGPAGAGQPVAPGAPYSVIADGSQAAQPAQQVTEPQPLLPWPTFPDGSPLPVGRDGQPDFSALGR